MNGEPRVHLFDVDFLSLSDVKAFGRDLFMTDYTMVIMPMCSELSEHVDITFV